MPQKLIKLKGINRNMNEYQCSGESEELINLRPHAGGGMSVVKPKKIFRDSVDYKQVYEHSFGDVSNLLAIDSIGVLWIAEGIYLAPEFKGKEVELSSAGNVLVISCKEADSQAVYKYENYNYVPYDISFGHLKDVCIVANQRETEHYQDIDVPSLSVDGINDALSKGASAIASKYEYALSGAAVVGCAYELEDGNEVWSTAFITVATSQKPELYESKVRVFGLTDVTLKLTFGAGEYEGIKRINVYSTKSVFPYEATYSSYLDEYGIRQMPLDEADLQGQIMHYQGSVTPKEGEVSIRLSFGTGLSAESIMDVNAGCIMRTGSNISLNNRFHYFNSSVAHVIQRPTMNNVGATVEIDSWAGYAKFNNEWKLIDGTFLFSPDKVNNFIYPMAGVTQLAFMRLSAELVHIETYAVTDYDRVPSHRYEYTLWRDTDMFYVDLKDSSAYNYSYAFDFNPSSNLIDAGSFYDRMQSAGQLFGTDEPDQTVSLRKEFNTINVSAQYNPFVFPVEYSYSFSGDVKDIATAYLPISSVQISQYPLTVFTTNGIYTMEQGDGSVMYKNTIPLQPLVIDGRATPTPYGTFFVSSNNLYIISGRDAANVSQVLNGKVEQNIRNVESYMKLCLSSHIINFSGCLSNEEFSSFISNASMTYDPLNNELFISSNDESITYSYVLNMDSKSYHKVSRKYVRPQNGARYAIEISNNVKAIVDLREEIDHVPVSVLIQSRPMSLELLYTHIQRLMLMVDAKLTGNEYLYVSVFAGDNLNDWKCIATSQKKDVTLRHIRTNKAPKSYKDYIILINGLVETDTDISDLIADYTVVNRRIG